MAPAYPVTRRVSYVIPPPSGHRTKLLLPPIDTPRRGRTSPLILPDHETSSNGSYGQQSVDEGQTLPSSRSMSRLHSTSSAAGVSHPQHRLGVSALALDMSTVMSGKRSPEGILYSAGRDGLIMAWEVGVPTKPRKRKPQEGPGPGLGSRTGDWKVMTAFDEEDDDVSDEEGDSDVVPLLRDRLAEEAEHEDEPLIGDGVDKDLPYERQWMVDHEKADNMTLHSVFRQGVQAHNDWVNDIALCNSNQSVVSASNDGLVKLWSPHDPSSSSLPSVVGKHSDYVHCVAYTPKKTWVASGSFDRTIKLWDITRSDDSGSGSLNPLSPIVTLSLPDASAKASIYALAVDSSGNMIVSGSPERVVRLWDPRSGRRVGKLVGHTDNIRSILISDDGKYILTGSSDASIKIWSVSGRRCLHTFSHHTESVWTLFSSHPTLSVFYSGDKSGQVCKVDMENCGNIAEGECVVLCRDDGDGAARNKCKEGINRVLAVDDWGVWTVTGASDIKRWRDPGSRSTRMTSAEPQPWDSLVHPPISETIGPSPLPNGLPVSRSSTPIAPFRGDSRQSTGGFSAFMALNDSPRSASPRFSESAPVPTSTPLPSRALRYSVQSLQSMTSVTTNPDDLQESSAKTLYGLPFESLVHLAPSDAAFSYKQSLSRNPDPEVATLYSAASVLSVSLQHRASPVQPHSPPGSPAFSPLYLSHAASSGNYKVTNRAGSLFQSLDSQLPDANLPQTESESREVAAEAKPLRSSPDDVIKGSHGLVRSIILNDRVHALTVDAAGEVALWDLVRCTYLGYFSSSEVEIASITGGGGGSEYGNTNGWSPRESLETVRERIEGEATIGSWATVDTKMGSLAVHLSEATCFDAEVYADEVGFAGNPSFPDEYRLNVGKWVLNNLFAGFIHAEISSGLRILDGQAATPGKGIQRVAPGTLSLDTVREWRLRSNSDLATRSHMTSGIVAALPPPMTPAVIPDLPKTPITPGWVRLSSGKEILPPTPGSQPGSNVGGVSSPGKMISSPDYFSMPSITSADHGTTTSQVPGTPVVPLTPGKLIRSWKGFGKTKKPVAEDVSAPQPIQESSEVIEEPVSIKATKINLEFLESLTQETLQTSTPLEAPPIRLPDTLVIMISEQASGEYGWSTIYHGLCSLVEGDVDVIEQTAPLWLLEFLLTSKITQPTSAKVGFVVLPWNKPGVEPMPNLMSNQLRLTASRVLRVRKVLIYVLEKLEALERGGQQQRAEQAPIDPARLSSEQIRNPVTNPPDNRAIHQYSESEFEILCNDVNLPLNMTLAAVRHYVWRQGGELVMHYRRKHASALDTRFPE